MKPLNRAERNNAFLGFLLLFFITIGIIIIVVFSSVKVAYSDNEQLRVRVSMMQKEKDLSEAFRGEMNVVLNEMATYDTRKDNVAGLRRSVQLKIEKMSKLVRTLPDEMSKRESSIYDLVIQNLEDLNDAKYKIRDRELRDLEQSIGFKSFNMNANDFFTRRVQGVDYRVWQTMLLACFLTIALYGFKQLRLNTTTEQPCLVDTVAINGKRVEYIANCYLDRYYQFAIQSDANATVEWEFRDDTNVEKRSIVSHKFVREGTYRITATVNGRCKFEAVVDVTYNPFLSGKQEKPTVDIFAYPEHPTTGNRVRFYCASDLSSISSYEWKVVNTGEVKNDAEPAFTFENEEHYKIELVINNDRSRKWKTELKVTKEAQTMPETPLNNPFRTGMPGNSESVGKLVTEEVNTPSVPKGPPPNTAATNNREGPAKPDSSPVTSTSKTLKIDPDAFRELLQNVVDQNGKEVEDLYDYLDYREFTKVVVNDKNDLIPLKDFCRMMRGRNRNKRKIEALSFSKKDDKDGSQYIKVKVREGRGPFGWF